MGRGFLAPLLALALAGCGGGERDSERDSGRRGDGGGLFGGGRNAQADAAKTAQAQAAPVSAPSPAAQPAPARGGTSASGQPVPGPPQRAAIMDALRPAIERELGGSIEFVVQRAAVQDGWALVIAQPQRPGGGAIRPPAGFDTEFRDGLTVNGILRFSGGGWTLVDHAIGPTDIWYCGVDGPPAALTGC